MTVTHSRSKENHMSSLMAVETDGKWRFPYIVVPLILILFWCVCWEIYVYIYINITHTQTIFWRLYKKLYFYDSSQTLVP